ncbi:molybdopterin-binding protein, partial [Bacillus cereus]
MNAEIIAGGNELLLGQIADTNAQFLSEQLASIGI